MHDVPRDAQNYLPDQIKFPGLLPAHFPRCVRLLKQKDFDYVFAAAKPFRSTAFTLLVRNNDLKYPRLGLAISKKAAPRSVDRNRLKRLVRETFRIRQNQLPEVDIVVLAKPEAVNMRNHEINRILAQQWARIAENPIK